MGWASPPRVAQCAHSTSSTRLCMPESATMCNQSSNQERALRATARAAQNWQLVNLPHNIQPVIKYAAKICQAGESTRAIYACGRAACYKYTTKRADGNEYNDPASVAAQHNKSTCLLLKLFSRESRWAKCQDTPAKECCKLWCCATPQHQNRSLYPCTTTPTPTHTRKRPLQISTTSAR